MSSHTYLHFDRSHGIFSAYNGHTKVILFTMMYLQFNVAAMAESLDPTALGTSLSRSASFASLDPDI